MRQSLLCQSSHSQWQTCNLPWCSYGETKQRKLRRRKAYMHAKLCRLQCTLTQQADTQKIWGSPAFFLLSDFLHAFFAMNNGVTALYSSWHGRNVLPVTWNLLGLAAAEKKPLRTHIRPEKT